MNLSVELLNVLQKAMDENKYHHPALIQGVLNAIEDTDPYADTLITDEMDKWAADMWSR